ncbi:cell division protein FtsL [Phenylobacterium soli]|uniref:Cell division protein n=1 Tax=Phenylobacterium soli TaxID=2170551 RepID=A0A328ANW7_9CAUL|nr:cell division protein [Phenylobacterium soli]RAK56055.1 cell division protein [Phenylobacterium soli]
MSLMARRVRGFRLVDIVALGVLVLLILGVYLAKTIAGRERAEIASAERQIAAEKTRIRLLQAEVTHLEQPARIEHLSETYLGMAPVSIKHEATADLLPEIALHPEPAPKVAALPEPGAAAQAQAGIAR